MSTNPTVIAQEPHLATSEEETLLALKLLAGHLRSISEGLERMESVESHEASKAAEVTASDRRAGDRWEKEGGACRRELNEAPMVKRSLVEHFSVRAPAVERKLQ